MADTGIVQYNSRDYRVNTPREEMIVSDALQEFAQMVTWRNTFAAQWEEVAQLIMPSSSNTFFQGAFNWPGQKKTQHQVDATAMMALSRFGAILDSLLTPRNMFWHALQAQSDDIKKDRDCRLWYEATTRKLFQHRYAPMANFSSQNQQNYQSLGAFGTGAMFVDQAVDYQGNLIPGLRYKALPLGEVFLRENHQGMIDGFIRWFRLTPRQAYQKWGERIPVSMIEAMHAHSETPVDFLHRVYPRTDFEPGRLDEKGMIFTSEYICVQGRCLLSESGYHTFPLAASRYDQAPGEVYGRGPAMMVLPAIKTLNAEKRVFLKQGHRAGDPVLLTADDGLVPNITPGAVNPGGMNSDGKPLIGILPSGNIQITLEMMQEEQKLINDAFLVSLFQIMTESPQMSATEVIERTNEKGILLAPTVGRQQSEYLGPLIDRELDLLAEMGELEPMPPLLREARGEYHVNYTSPLARAMRAQEVAGFQRTIQGSLEIVKVTGDVSIFDNFDFDTATRDTAEIQAVPETWMADPAAIDAKRKARAQAQQRQEAIQAAPAQAAMMKAQMSKDAQQLTTNNTGPTQPGAFPGNPGPGQ